MFLNAFITTDFTGEGVIVSGAGVGSGVGAGAGSGAGADSVGGCSVIVC